MKWLAEIRVESDPEGIMERVLERIGYSILPEEVSSAESIVIFHPEFDATGSANEVHRGLEELAEQLGANSEVLGTPIRVTDIVIRELKPDGNYSNHFYEQISVRMVASVSVTEHYDPGPNFDPKQHEAALLEKRQLEEEAQKEKLISRMALSLSNPSVPKVLRLLQLNEPSATDLGHIVDLVRDQCNGDIREFATKAEQQRFERSINHPEVMGLKARHAVTRAEPPPKPMSIEEAKDFARRVGAAWLNCVENHA